MQARMVNYGGGGWARLTMGRLSPESPPRVDHGGVVILTLRSGGRGRVELSFGSPVQVKALRRALAEAEAAFPPTYVAPRIVPRPQDLAL